MVTTETNNSGSVYKYHFEKDSFGRDDYPLRSAYEKKDGHNCIIISSEDDGFCEVIFLEDVASRLSDNSSGSIFDVKKETLELVLR